MTDDLEARLRQSLRRAALPAAPDALHGFLDNVPLDAPRVTSRIGLRAAPLAVGVAAIVVLALGFGTLVLTSPAPSASPAVTPTATQTASSGPSAGFRRFEAPGISFDHPADWTDQSDVNPQIDGPGIRSLVVLARGLPVCREPEDSTKPTPDLNVCQTDATRPGSMILRISEYTRPYPGSFRNGTQHSIAGYPVWERATTSDPEPTVWLYWAVQAPDGGLYFFYVNAPQADVEARRSDVLTLLGSLRLSAWETGPTAVDGRVHLDLPQGFSFDYPAGWNLYYSQDWSMMDGSIVTVASKPITALCTTDGCHGFTTPPGATAIEFRGGNGPRAPDWKDAPLTIGGQPAFLWDDWGPDNATGADEGHSWGVRLRDPTVLGINASLRGPNLPELRTAMHEVMDSIRITPEPSPTP
jgi:hypothetical protein